MTSALWLRDIGAFVLDELIVDRAAAERRGQGVFDERQQMGADEVHAFGRQLLVVVAQTLTHCR